MTIKELLDKVDGGTFIRIYRYNIYADARVLEEEGFMDDITMVDCAVFTIAVDDADRIDIVIQIL